MGLINPPGLGPLKPGYGRILTFALDATSTLNVTPFGYSEPPVPARPSNASAETVREGQALYDSYCLGCHGVMAIAGSLPDLRYATAEVHDQFEAIVRYGARVSRGMPPFGDLLNSDQVEAIRAYVLSRAEASSAEAQTSPSPD